MRFLRLDSDEAVAARRRLGRRPASPTRTPVSRPDLREPAFASGASAGVDPAADADPTAAEAEPTVADASEAGSHAGSLVPTDGFPPAGEGLSAGEGASAGDGSSAGAVSSAAAEAHSGDESPRAELFAGFRIVAPAVLAVLPLGLALGVLVVQSGLAWWWAPIFAAIVFAGSMEFLLVGLLAAAAPLSQIAVSTLLVNFRHVFYALSFPLNRVHGRAAKAYSTFALTDEAYAIAAGPQARSWSKAKILGVQSLFHIGWVSFVAAGAGLGLLIPVQIPGLDFAVTALVVVLALEGYRVQRSLPAPALALVCGLVGLLISPENMLIISMSLFTVGLLVAYLLRGRRTRG